MLLASAVAVLFPRGGGVAVSGVFDYARAITRAGWEIGLRPCRVIHEKKNSAANKATRTKQAW